MQIDRCELAVSKFAAIEKDCLDYRKHRTEAIGHVLPAVSALLISNETTLPSTALVPAKR
jgi:hypothetical protein